MLESYCHLSGDLFGWHPTDDGGITLWQLDVSGHGVRAGFAAVVFKLILGNSDLELPLTDLVEHVETQFIEIRNPDDPGCIYATGVFLRIDRNGGVEYLSAGHPPLLVRRADGTVERFEATMVPIALLPEREAVSSGFELDPRDAVMVATDGLIELVNAEDDIFGIDRVVSELAATDGSPMAVFHGLIEAVDQFHELERLDDDLSFIVLRRRASS
jgi:sigma-B regulation protein RsbU (phosphoserine phosphatase)